jgi:hypothetical protein
MSIPYPFQIEGADGEFSSEINGYLFTVTIKLTDVPGDNDIAQMFNALTDSNVPLIGTDLSGVNLDLTGCWLRNIKTTPLGNHQWRLVLSYQHSPFNQVRSDGIQISTQTQVSEVQTNKRVDGSPIVTRYEYPDNYTFDDELAGTLSSEQGGTVSKLIPESTRVYTVREEVDGNSIARDFLGKLNDDVWQNGIAGTWMLTGVTGERDNSQQSLPIWVNSYTFQFKSDGWDTEIFFTDSNTNEPIPDPADFYIDPDTALSVVGSRVDVQLYFKKDFTLLFPAVDA